MAEAYIGSEKFGAGCEEKHFPENCVSKSGEVGKSMVNLGSSKEFCVRGEAAL
jgi:hypothetical protein